MFDSEYFNGKYRIKTVRADWIDYNNGDFLVTICTKNKYHYFGHIENGKMHLTDIGLYAMEALQNIPNHNPYCEVLGFVIMPNHVHLILSIINICETQYIASLPSKSATLSQMRIIAAQRSLLARTIANFKSAITRYANEQNIEFKWQPRYHDAFIRNQAMMNKIADYVDNNVVRWETDCYY